MPVVFESDAATSIALSDSINFTELGSMVVNPPPHCFPVERDIVVCFSWIIQYVYEILYQYPGLFFITPPDSMITFGGMGKSTM